jgi:hypothetical protein
MRKLGDPRLRQAFRRLLRHLKGRIRPQRAKTGFVEGVPTGSDKGEGNDNEKDIVYEYDVCVMDTIAVPIMTKPALAVVFKLGPNGLWPTIFLMSMHLHRQA